MDRIHEINNRVNSSSTKANEDMVRSGPPWLRFAWLLLSILAMAVPGDGGGTEFGAEHRAELMAVDGGRSAGGRLHVAFCTS